MSGLKAQLIMSFDIDTVDKGSLMPVGSIRSDRKDSTATDDDDILLAKMGYKPTLHRGLDSFMNFAFGFTEVAVLASVCITFGFGLNSGGPSVLVWGFAVNFGITMIIAHCMAEICSAYPSAGSVYHWAGQIAPKDSAPLWSYICGWANFLGNAAGDASFGNAFGSFLSSALVASGYEAIGAYQQVGISISILFVWSVLNFFRVDRVGIVNNVAAVCHVGSIIIILVSVLSKVSHLSSGSFVFSQYFNGTGFDSHSYVGALGITAALFSFAGSIYIQWSACAELFIYDIVACLYRIRSKCAHGRGNI
jgi:amino acid transporter